MNSKDAGTMTPILDLLKPLPKPQEDDFRLPKYFPLITLLIVVVVFQNYELLGAIIGLIFIALVTTAIHEFGHVAAGCSVGLHFVSMGIGPIWVRRESRTWSVKLRRHLVTGMTVMSLDRMYRVRRRLTIYVAGGPTAGFLSGVIALIAFRVAVKHDHPFVSLILICFGSYSLYLNFLSLLLARSGHYLNDGMILRALHRSKERAKQLLAEHALEIQKRNGCDPFRLNLRWVKLASSDNGITDPRYHAYINDWNAYQETTETDAAAQFLERCLTNSGFLNTEDRDVLILEASIFTALRRDDSVKADTWFNRASCPERIHPLVRLRAETALSFAHRRFSEALKYLENGLEILRQLPLGERGGQLETAWVNWRLEIEKRRDTAPGVGQGAVASTICN